MPPENPTGASATRATTVAFIVLCVAVLIGVTGYTLYSRSAVGPVTIDPGSVVADDIRIFAIRQRPHVVFRVTTLDSAHGLVGIVPLDDPAAAPVVAGIACDRVYASQQNALCLQADRGVFTTYRAVSLDAGLREQHSFPLEGAPSRTRVAPTAALGASTVFVSGDSYASGSFSTRTTIFNLEGRTPIGDLETFTVERDGQPFKKIDFNFWGVTFAADGDRFYATLATGGQLFLVQGSVSARHMKVIGTDVECPMLSPDGTRVAYKRRIVSGGLVTWGLRVMDLDTRAVTDLPETRNVDDQPEWLDDDHVLYALSREGTGSSDVWAVRADGTGEPRLFIPDAFSPAVVRAGFGSTVSEHEGAAAADETLP